MVDLRRRGLGELRRAAPRRPFDSHLVTLTQSWTVVLTLAKLALSYSQRLHALQSPSAPHRPLPFSYTTLEMHIIPWYFIAASIAFFDVRSAVIAYSSPGHYTGLPLHLDIAIYVTTSALFLLELMAPRPSRFSSRSSAHRTTPTDGSASLPRALELHASLLSQVTFSYLDRNMFGSAFPSLSKSPPISMDTIPDLRPDDKTARVLLSYRRDVAQLARFAPSLGRPQSGLTPKLAWHFRHELLAQQLWSYVRVAVIALPPLFLKGLLAHIGKRSRGEDAPMHVALLYAGAMVFFQIVASLAASQSLYIGRRICIRLRSVHLRSASLLPKLG